MGMRPGVPSLEELPAGALEDLLHFRLRPPGQPGSLGHGAAAGQDVHTPELPVRVPPGRDIAVVVDSVMGDEDRRSLTEDFADFIGRPDIEDTLTVLAGRRIGAVGVLGRIKAAVRMGQLPLDIVENPARHPRPFRVVRQLIQLQVGRGELGLVVEHLFEVGHMPDRIDRITVKTTPEMIPHPARRHRPMGRNRHLQTLRPDFLRRRRCHRHPVEKEKIGRPGKLRSSPKAAPGLVERFPEVVKAGPELLRIERARRPGGMGGVLLQGLRGMVPLGDHPFPIVIPELSQLLQDAEKARSATAVVGRKVGAAENGLPIGGQPDTHRPSATSGGGLDIGHVDPVHVGPLLPVHLDADELVVQKGCDRLILE